MTGNAGFNGYGQPRYGDDTDQVNQYASHSSKSTLSLTYDASFQSQGGGKGDANVPYPTENQLPGYPPLYPTIHEQPEQPTPVSKMRKAPTTNLPPIQTDQMRNNVDNRRIVSSPHLQHPHAN